jgi:hypothetical protein
MNNACLRSLIAVGAVVSLAGCASTGPDVRVDQLESGLPDCKTFAWHSSSGDAASFSEQRVRIAVQQELEKKGYAIAAENPVCKIAYHLTTREIPKPKPSVGVGVGGGSRGVGGGIGVSLPVGRKNGYTGTFTLDVIDASRNAQVWSGSVDVEVAEAELTDDEARKLAAIVLKRYPDAR